MKVPRCYKIGENGFCQALFSNDYWSYKKCRFCALAPWEWCGTCKWLRFNGPHATCGHPSINSKGFTGWMSLKKSAWITRKCDIGRKSGCSNYERP